MKPLLPGPRNERLRDRGVRLDDNVPSQHLRGIPLQRTTDAIRQKTYAGDGRYRDHDCQTQ